MKLFENIVNSERVCNCGFKKIIFLIIGIVLLLSYVSVFGLGRYWWILIIGAISLALACGLVSILMVIYAVVWNWQMIRHHPDLWARSLFRISIQERVQASREIASLKHPFLERMGFGVNKLGILVFKIWLFAFILATVVFLVLEFLGVNLELLFENLKL